MFGGKETAAGAALRRNLEELAALQVNIGFNDSSGSYKPDGKQSAGSVSVAQVAAWNEFGTEHSPARPFMRQTITDQRDKISKFVQNRARNVVNGSMDAQTALNGIGSYAKGRMQAEIRDGDFEPNAPSTVARKGSSKPLIDTGRMRQSVVYEITAKEE